MTMKLPPRQLPRPAELIEAIKRTGRGTKDLMEQTTVAGGVQVVVQSVPKANTNPGGTGPTQT